jgi:hypothetical protein
MRLDGSHRQAAIVYRQAATIIPIRKNGLPWNEDCPAAISRNETLRATRHYGRALWKRWTGYHARSRIEGEDALPQGLRRTYRRQRPLTAKLQKSRRIALMNRFSTLGAAEIIRLA